MTATTTASQVITPAAACPAKPWCDGHNAGTTLHIQEASDTWGALESGPQLGLALECDDDSGTPAIDVRISHDGILIDGSSPLGLDDAEDFAFSILRLVAAGRAKGRSVEVQGVQDAEDQSPRCTVFDRLIPDRVEALAK